MTLKELQQLQGKARKKALRNMTEEEKLSIVDEIIDRDAEIWKTYNRRGYCDFCVLLARN